MFILQLCVQCGISKNKYNVHCTMNAGGVLYNSSFCNSFVISLLQSFCFSRSVNLAFSSSKKEILVSSNWHRCLDSSACTWIAVNSCSRRRRTASNWPIWSARLLLMAWASINALFFEKESLLVYEYIICCQLVLT